MNADIKKEIFDTLSTNGLEVAEDVAIELVRAAFGIVRVLAPKVSKFWALILLPILGQLEPKIMTLLDNIDKHDDPAL